MSTLKGSFAQRMASMASPPVENWDDDGDLQGDFFGASTSTRLSISSRASMRSESNAGADDWELLAPHDDASALKTIASAKQAGIPIPTSAPMSAFQSGTITRIQTKKSNRKLTVDDDWGEDLELPPVGKGRLELKAPMPRTPQDDQDEFDDWGEGSFGSLGIRFAGTNRGTRGGRSSSGTAMSPSIGSCMTFESDDDDMTGLVLPNEPLDFTARLEKLRKAEHPTPDVSPLPVQQKRELPPTSAPAPHLEPSLLPPHVERTSAPKPQPKSGEDDDDFLDGLDIGSTNALDTTKLKLNRNVVVKKPSTKSLAPAAARAATTTLTFTDKPSASRIPRLLNPGRSRLTPVYESGASTQGQTRPMPPLPTTTSAQFLRAKRSAPMLRNNDYGAVPRPPAPFLPAGSSTAQSHHVTARASQPNIRRGSDPRRPPSPSMRSYSRMSASNPPDTPSRTGMRREVPPATIAQRNLRRTQSKPLDRLKKAYGDGSELENFDDLPTSAAKEKTLLKEPKNAQGRTLRHLASAPRMTVFDRMSTPLPQTPKSPPKMDHTPRFARDTAASRIAREQRLASSRPRGEGPVAPTQRDWKAQVAARSPHSSPQALRKKGSGLKPMLIKAMSSAPTAKHEKGMTYNPTLQRWEGNEEALAPFSHPNTSTTTLALTTASTPTFAPPGHGFHSHDRSQSISHTALSTIHAAQNNVSSRAVNIAPRPVPSPPRPALITQKTAPRAVQYEGGMEFDPVKMAWMKVRYPRESGDPRSPTVDNDDEEDPFSGIEDLKEKSDPVPAFGGDTLNIEENTFVGEEFDLGPSFIQRQREEELAWRKRTEDWVGAFRDNGEKRHDGFKWYPRRVVAEAGAWRWR